MVNETLLKENLIPFLQEAYPLSPVRYFQVNSEYFISGLSLRNFDFAIRQFREQNQDISVEYRTEGSIQITRMELNLYYINKRDF